MSKPSYPYSRKKKGVKEGEIESDKLYTLFDTSRKFISQYLEEYNFVKNYNSRKQYGSGVDHRYKLMDLYDYAMQDLHLTSVTNSLFHQILGERYFLGDASGAKNEVATLLIKKKWFVKVIRAVLDSKLYGFNLIELGDLDEVTGTLKSCEVIERRNVAPSNNLVLEHFNDYDGWDITEKRFARDYILVDGQEDLGLLLKAVPIIISKRWAIAAHTQNAENFGMPFFHGKSESDDPDDRLELAQQIVDAARDKVIITGIEDEVRLLQDIKNDTNKIYTSLVEVCNSEVSKLILGQTATIDNTSYVGSAQIMFQIYQDHIEAIREFVVSVINEDILPRLIEKGMKLDGLSFQYSNTIETSPETKTEIYKVLLAHYEVDPSEIEREFGIKVGKQYSDDRAKKGLSPSGQSGGVKGSLKEVVNTIENNTPKIITRLDDLTKGCSLHENCSKQLSLSEIANEINFETELDGFEAIIEEVVSNHISGGESDHFLPSLIALSVEQYLDGIEKEFDIDFRVIDIHSPSNTYYKGLFDNVFEMSGSKQFQLLALISSLSKNNSDNVNNFLSEALRLNSLFNSTYSKSEYDYTRHAMKMARVWRSIENPEEILEYHAIGDQRTRPWHMALNGVRRRKSDSFWNTFMPPWEFGCRCWVDSTGTTNGQKLNLDRKIPDASVVPKEFRFNVGETPILFSTSLPYFNIKKEKIDGVIKAISDAKFLMGYNG